MTVTRQKVVIALSVLGIVVGLSLCFFHLRTQRARAREEQRKYTPPPSSFQVEVVRVLPASTMEEKLKNTYITGHWQNRPALYVIRDILKAANVYLKVGGRTDVFSLKTSHSVENVSINDAIVQMLAPLEHKAYLRRNQLNIGPSRNHPPESAVELALDAPD